jgi:hypothetical protein
MSRTFTSLLLASAFVVIGCRNSAGPYIPPIDLGPTGGGGNGGSGGGGGSGGSGGGGGASGGDMAKSYVQSSIQQMRMQGQYGAFELDNVVVVGATPTGKKAFVQDSVGGDFSAIELDCSSTSATHMCTLQSTVKTAAVGDSVTLKGTYVKAAAKNGGYEAFYIDSITDNGPAATKPPVGTITLAEAIKTASAMTAAKWFQKVNVTLTDDLVMFDYTPTEFVYTGATKCPYQFGWGMVPKTGAPALTSAQVCGSTCATTACTTAATAQTATNANEVLIGTDFYVGFTMSSDCRCLSSFKNTAPDSTKSIAKTATLSGVLVFDVPSGATTGYQYLAPVTTADFPMQ